MNRTALRLSPGTTEILHLEPPMKLTSEAVYLKAGSLYSISGDITIGEAGARIVDDEALEVIGVTDSEKRAQGYITRDSVLSLLGHKFGREIYSSRPITEAMKNADTVYYKRNIFSFIDEIGDALEAPENRYYLLTDEQEKFRGIISTGDIKIFLSLMMRNDLRAARRIHNKLVRNEVCITNDFFSFTAATIMAGEIGGDFHLIKKIDDTRWILSLCDVSGKGIKAALIAVAISGMFNTYSFTNDITDLIKKLNRFIFDLFEGEIFVTGVFIVFDEKTGELTLYDMGHSLFYLVKNNKIVRPASHNGNFPAGIKREIEPEPAYMKLSPGNMLIAVTDGITEQTGPSGEQFGEQRLLYNILKTRNNDTIEIRNSIFSQLSSFRSGQARSDDMSIFLLKRSFSGKEI